MSYEDKQIRTNIRMSEELKSDLQKLAKIDGRSLNYLMMSVLSEYRDEKFKELNLDNNSNDSSCE